MKTVLALLLTTGLLFAAPAVAVAKTNSNFGRMFVGLPPLNQQTNQQLADLAQTMLEPAAINNPKGTTGGVTFFGQFIDHDLTLDTQPQPTDTVNVEGLLN